MGVAVASDNIQIGGLTIPVHSMNTLVVGSGAASLNAALQLAAQGYRNVAIATEHWGGGTSYNAGSDKQTYYKLSLEGDAGDAPLHMAGDLFRGGSMHGDLALCEAQHSAQAFHHLVGLGVPFPHDRYGGYVGYRTDHDPRGRATSAGPYTSRFMCQRLGEAVRDKGITVFDRHCVVALLTDGAGDEKRVCGAVAIDKARLDAEAHGLVVFNAVNVVLGTGGPGVLYKDSVYPGGQTGATGLALAIGAAANNLTESQFGLASVSPRWNLSGSYQQVIPRYVSTDAQGRDEREFLNDHFPDMPTLATAIFRKGYEWPFDCAKVLNFGSSLIDVLVLHETATLGRRVFLDYSRSPSGGGEFGSFSLDLLDEEARAYLRQSAAFRPTPIERLAAMNEPAIEVFRSHRIDLARQRLEIAVCAQHNNGGLRGNIWWESNIRHLFPIGEVSGTHGVYRPGGAALNAGQVGGLRAAMFIAKRYHGPAPAAAELVGRAGGQIEAQCAFVCRISSGEGAGAVTPQAAITEIRQRMSTHAALVRDRERIVRAVTEAWAQNRRLQTELRVPSAGAIPSAFKARQLCLTHAVYLEAIREYLAKGGKSRGSALVPDPAGQRPCEGLGDEWRFSMTEADAFVNGKILEVRIDDRLNVREQWVDIRPIPREQRWFETVWREYLRDDIIR